MNCQKCGQETVFPFHCQYCGGQFCSEHHLPESHNCPKIDLARSRKQAEVLAPDTNTYRISYSYGPPIKNRGHVYFSQKELWHIIGAVLLILGIGFSIAFYSGIWNLGLMSIFAALLTISFLTHEMAHKIVAQKKGLWAEFRLTMFGALLTLASVFLPFKMISPGAMMISGSPNRDAIIKISLAGPITNMIFAVAFLSVAFTLPSVVGSMLFFVAYINAFISLFNLVPFGVLDGLKIFNLSKKIWTIAFAVSVILTVITYLATLMFTRIFG